MAIKNKVNLIVKSMQIKEDEFHCLYMYIMEQNYFVQTQLQCSVIIN